VTRLWVSAGYVAADRAGMAVRTIGEPRGAAGVIAHRGARLPLVPACPDERGSAGRPRASEVDRCRGDVRIDLHGRSARPGAVRSSIGAPACARATRGPHRHVEDPLRRPRNQNRASTRSRRHGRQHGLPATAEPSTSSTARGVRLLGVLSQLEPPGPAQVCSSSTRRAPAHAGRAAAVEHAVDAVRRSAQPQSARHRWSSAISPRTRTGTRSWGLSAAVTSGPVHAYVIQQLPRRTSSTPVERPDADPKRAEGRTAPRWRAGSIRRRAGRGGRRRVGLHVDRSEAVEAARRGGGHSSARSRSAPTRRRSRSPPRGAPHQVGLALRSLRCSSCRRDHCER
jgi:hypothetical protein